MPHSVTKLELDKKRNRYNYRLTYNLRYKERAQAVIDYLHEQLCMPFKNGMGYSLSVDGSTLVLDTIRCSCNCGELKCLTPEMEGDEYRMVCDVFDTSVKNAVKAVDRID